MVIKKKLKNFHVDVTQVPKILKGVQSLWVQNYCKGVSASDLHNALWPLPSCFAFSQQKNFAFDSNRKPWLFSFLSSRKAAG